MAAISDSGGGAVRPLDAMKPVLGTPNHTDVIRRATGAHSIDGVKVVAFCEDRIERMRSPLTAAIYAGLADRVLRGFFDQEGDN